MPYPTVLDNLLTNKNDATVMAGDHATHHNALADALNRIEAELGLDPSGTFATVRARLDAIKTSYVFNVKDHGATGDGTTDDTTALVAAATALQTAGGGKFVLPPGIYLWDGVTTIGSFSGINGVEIEMQGAKIVTTHVYTLGTFVSAFLFTNCSRIKFTGRGETPILSGQNKESGPVWIDLLDNCDDVEFHLYQQGGLGVRVRSSDSTDDTKRSHGIRGVIRAYNAAYVFNCQNSGDNADVEIFTDSSWRSYICYGVQNHEVQIHSRNSVDEDCILEGFGRPTENIRLKYVNTDTTGISTNSSTCVKLQFIGPTAQGFRNISIELDVQYNNPGAVSLGNGFTIAKYASDGGSLDTLDRGHILDGLTVRGRVDGRSKTGDTSVPLAVSGTWGGTPTPSADIWRNIDIRLSSSTLDGFGPRQARIDLSSLSGQAVVRYLSSGNLEVDSNAGAVAAVVVPTGRTTLYYLPTVRPHFALASPQTLTVTNGTALTINAPDGKEGSDGEIIIEVYNNSGGAMGVITWNGYTFGGLAWVNPANTKKRWAKFIWNGSTMLCTAIAGADY